MLAVCYGRLALGLGGFEPATNRRAPTTPTAGLAEDRDCMSCCLPAGLAGLNPASWLVTVGGATTTSGSSPPPSPPLVGSPDIGIFNCYGTHYDPLAVTPPLLPEFKTGDKTTLSNVKHRVGMFNDSTIYLPN